MSSQIQEPQPVQYVITLAGDPVYRGGDRVIIGTDSPTDPPCADVPLGQSPGAIIHEYAMQQVTG